MDVIAALDAAALASAPIVGGVGVLAAITGKLPSSGTRGPRLADNLTRTTR